jgi:tetratricopeptide (TPR) repeat protein
MTPFEHEIDELLTQAEALLHDARPMDALPLLERARTLMPHNAWVSLFRGVALGQLGRVDEAVEQLLSAADQNTDDLDIQVDAARHLCLLEFAQDALVCAERAIDLDPTDAGAHLIYAEALERLGRIAEALPIRELAQSLDADDLDNLYYLALDLCELGRHEDALDIADPLCVECADDPDILRLVGACLSYLGRHQDALSRWAEIERLEGVSANLLHNRASTLDAMGRSDEALVTIDQAILADPEMAINYYTRGMIHEHVGDEAAAIEDYLCVLALDPAYLDAVINIVELATATGESTTVLARIAHLREAEPTSAHLHYAAGRLAVEAGDLPQGIESLEAAVSREPALGVGWYSLSMLYAFNGDFEQAIQATDQAMRAYPDDAGLWLNRGLALHELKRFEEAAAAYDQACRMTPEDGMPWFHLGRLLLLDLERPRDARGALREALHWQPEHDAVLWMLALCHLRLGEILEATTLLETLFHQYPDHLWGWLVRAARDAQLQHLESAVAGIKCAVAQGYDPRLLLNEPLFAPLREYAPFTRVIEDATRTQTKKSRPRRR